MGFPPNFWAGEANDPGVCVFVTPPSIFVFCLRGVELKTRERIEVGFKQATSDRSGNRGRRLSRSRSVGPSSPAILADGSLNSFTRCPGCCRAFGLVSGTLIRDTGSCRAVSDALAVGAPVVTGGNACRLVVRGRNGSERGATGRLSFTLRIRCRVPTGTPLPMRAIGSRIAGVCHHIWIEQNWRLKTSMILTSQQKDLLFAIVDEHLSGDGAPFSFVESHTGSGLCYPCGRSIPVSATEVDFRQLAKEGLITFARVSRSLNGKPTQLGIETVASLRGKAVPSGDPARLPDTTRPVSRALRPLTSLGGISPPPTPTIRAPRITYEYPEDFPQSAQQRIFAEQMRAEEFLDEKKGSIRDEADADALLLEFVLRVFAAFAEEICNLGIQGTWSGERIESECHGFLRHLAHAAHLTSGGEIRDNVRSEIERSAEWKEYRRRLREVADTQAKHEPMAVDKVRTSPANKTTHVAVLETILEKRSTTLAKWADHHKVGRTTLFDWKAAQVSSKSLKGKVSDAKIAAIEKAIEHDAKELGLALGLALGPTRTSSDWSE